MRYLIVLTCLGLSACGVPTSDAALCGPVLSAKVASLRAGLEANPQTPSAVGEPATDVVRGYEAGCDRWGVFK